MKAWLDSLLSELHRDVLKPRGYRKQGRTFSRNRGGYTERFNVQGSTSNGSFPTWRFFVNVGIEFHDEEPERYWSLFPHTHWATRAESIVGGAPPYWHYSAESDREELKAQLAELIHNASAWLDASATTLRADYLDRKKAQSHWRRA